jgi:DNA-binding NarL/FixJ family response regulator
MVAAGKNNQQIAEALVLSQHTVVRHVSNILGKTGCANRTEAATYALSHQLT